MFKPAYSKVCHLWGGGGGEWIINGKSQVLVPVVQNTDNAYILDKSLFTKSHNNIDFPKIYLLDSNLSSG